MAASNIVIVESPAKAKTINKYLGSGYQVLASYGHVRDLEEKDGSVKPDHDFEMTWEVGDKAAKPLKAITSAVKGAKKLILATDPDREGEAISWHLIEVLKKNKALKDIPVERVVFNAITKSAVLEAMAKPRSIDSELVDAYLARRALDYLFGYNLSPVLWRKLPGARSAGRVQSVALRIIVDREIEIEKFKSQEYWTVDAVLTTPAGETFTARLVRLNGEKLDKFSLANEAAAQSARQAIEAGKFAVTAIESKPARRNPPPPFTTSTLQQEAARKLGFSASHTMRIAQRLYEGVELDGDTVGLITYMRTDGVDVTPEAIAQTRKLIGNRFSDRHVPETPRVYKVKAKNAQEAHEAIRPTDLERTPDDVARVIEPDMARLYELIWKRMVASQMESAEFERTTIDIETGDNRTGLRATGSVLTFDGFLALYQEGQDDAGDDDDSARLPKVANGDATGVKEVKPEQHFTEPPPRFSEASLVKKLEELGIGRPSTYASTLEVLRRRAYVRMDQKRFIPEDKGRLVIAFLENFFEHYVEYNFTANLEEQLDQVSAGELKWKDLLRDFWKDFHAAIEDISELRITNVLDTLNEVLAPHIFPQPADGGDPRKCPSCADGTLGLRLGKYGAFIGCSNYPECSYTRPFATPGDGEGNGVEARTLGTDPAGGKSVYLKVGRFGPYLQLGDDPPPKPKRKKGEPKPPKSEADDVPKPKRAGIPRGEDTANMTLERALQFLSLPREVGIHPETGTPIVANLGRFGPYVVNDGTYANLESLEDVFTIGLNRAVTLIAEKKAKGGKSFRRQAQALKELGNDPSGAAVKVMSGRYGPYVTDGTVNATLPRGADPQNTTLQQALDLIAARIEAGGGPKKKKKAAKKDGEAKPSKKAAAKEAKDDAKPAKAAKASSEKTAKKASAKKKVLEETDT
ncbi:MAG: type I DNA topoisomerase [Alphaproteobacteria bacterium]|nr:type I DNA topoisomerase [Alphaproteobacteria bacterium]